MMCGGIVCGVVVRCRVCDVWWYSVWCGGEVQCVCVCVMCVCGGILCGVVVRCRVCVVWCIVCCGDEVQCVCVCVMCGGILCGVVVRCRVCVCDVWWYTVWCGAVR